MNAFDRFVGIPYLERGRTPAGCDCYGLLRLVLAELGGIDLPSFADLYVTAADRHAISCLIEGGLDQWDRIASGKEQIFDGVLMRRAREVRHIGVVVAPGLVLHVDHGETSRIERYRSPQLAPRIVGFYRFRASAT